MQIQYSQKDMKQKSLKVFVNGTYFLEVEGDLDANEYEKISKLKNVTINN